MRLLSHVRAHRAALSGAGLLLVGVLIGYGVSAWRTAASPAAVTAISESGISYEFVRPLLGFRAPRASSTGSYGALQSAFSKIETAAKNSGAVTRASLYFRDLDTGAWVGVNENDAYHPASLLKVPVMIAYFKEAEADPGALRGAIAYDPTVAPPVPFDMPSKLVAGQSYTVTDLIRRMIGDSDNGATFTLLNRLNPDFLHSVYVALGIPDPGDDSANYQISARTYAFFFRVLYNATYLSAEDSEQALKLLGDATFADGIVSGVPEGTPVAHKYGEHVLAENGAEMGVELSDCGIVYYPAHPYALCVMTDAKDLSSAEEVMKDASSAAYAAVEKQYGR